MGPAKQLKYIPLTMVRDHLHDVPHLVCPSGYTIRTFRSGDEEHWARVETFAEEFASSDEALRAFVDEFGSRWGELHDRCFLLEEKEGGVIGTAMAWDGDFVGKVRGRVHWVGIIPAYQGRGLARPLLGAVLERLARDHRTCFLTTQTTSYRAVNLYLKFSFMPYLTGILDTEGWRMMEDVLQRRILPADMEQ